MTAFLTRETLRRETVFGNETDAGTIVRRLLRTKNGLMRIQESLQNSIRKRINGRPPWVIWCNRIVPTTNDFWPPGAYGVIKSMGTNGYAEVTMYRAKGSVVMAELLLWYSYAKEWQDKFKNANEPEPVASTSWERLLGVQDEG